ncbi:HNH endonuclease [Gimesia maris]|uniref:HNH endonuclease n=1 Tax=Gimesia maris TaxID=122 RepID=UPI0018D8B97D|nr:HNH endonuclease signature motif containing protein [Gimesia maris]
MQAREEHVSNSKLPTEFESEICGILRSQQVPTTKEQLILARVGQGQFRKQVLTLWNDRCAVTGTTFAVRASHIKPWRDSNEIERLDPNNGLALVATLDALFDSHLISFDVDGNIILSSRLPEHEWALLGISSDMRFLNKPSIDTEQYLQLHRKHLLL